MVYEGMTVMLRTMWTLTGITAGGIIPRLLRVNWAWMRVSWTPYRGTRREPQARTMAM